LDIFTQILYLKFELHFGRRSIYLLSWYQACAPLLLSYETGLKKVCAYFVLQSEKLFKQNPLVCVANLFILSGKLVHYLLQVCAFHLQRLIRVKGRVPLSCDSFSKHHRRGLDLYLRNALFSGFLGQEIVMSTF
jgi:hypothetical protein